MYEKHGSQYHWVIELFRLLKLPVFDGVHAAPEVFIKQRKAELDHKKTDKCKRRQIELKVLRMLDSQRHKKWSKKHCHNTYSSGDSGEEGVELKPRGPKGSKKRQVSNGRKCRACGSTSHHRSNH